MKRSMQGAMPWGGAVVLMSASLAWAAPPQGMSSQSGPGQMQARQVIQDWPDTARQAAQEMLEKYGEPDAATSERLVWQDNGPWVRTIVHKQEIQHNFPAPHKDVLEQVVNYEVPPDKVSDLVKFDGSIAAYRTSGELSTRCDKEAANILTLNLANDIVEGKRDVQEARKFAARTRQEVMQGEEPQYVQRLAFEPQMANATADPDEEMRVQVASSQAPGGQSRGQPSGSGRAVAGGAAAGAGAAAGMASEGGPSMTSSDLTGKKIVSADGEEVGEVTGIVMNQEGQPLARVQLDDGFLGIGATEIVLPVSELSTTTDGKLKTPMSRDKLQSLRQRSESSSEDDTRID